jgi:hypothetical protein
MKLNYVVKALMSFVLVAFVMFASPAVSIASPILADAGSKVQSKVGEDTANTKGFVREAREKVKEAANSNASKVSDADKGGFFSKKAQRDAGRIERRANEDAARTQKAIDNTKDAVNKAVNGVRDAVD